jgi:transcriptional regulator with XRE-family HTH domain
VHAVETPERVILDVGRRIGELRRDRGWTQEKAAERMKLEVRDLQRIEAGVNVTLRTLVRLANALGVRTRSLLDPPQSRRPRRPGRPKRVQPQ